MSGVCCDSLIVAFSQIWRGVACARASQEVPASALTSELPPGFFACLEEGFFAVFQLEVGQQQILHRIKPLRLALQVADGEQNAAAKGFAAKAIRV